MLVVIFADVACPFMELNEELKLNQIILKTPFEFDVFAKNRRKSVLVRLGSNYYFVVFFYYFL